MMTELETQERAKIGRFRLDTRKMYETSSSRFWKDLYAPSNKKADYSMKIINIGFDYHNNPVKMNITDAFRSVFIAMTGDGKTFCIRRIISVAHKAGYAIFIAPDPKNEFYTNNKPVQARFMDNLADKEEPEAIPTVVYRPTFFKDVEKKLPKGNTWISIDLSEFTRKDFYTLINRDGMLDNQQRDADALWSYLKKTTHTGFNDVEKACEELSLKTLWNKIKHLKDKNLFDSRYKVDIIQDLKDGNVVALNYNGFESFSTDDYGIDQVFLAIHIRKVREARDRGDIPPLIIINDETPRWVPKEGNPISKEIILDSVQVDRRKNISWIFAEQNINDVDEKILKQSKWIFAGKSLESDDIQNILRRVGMILHRGYDNAMFRRIMHERSRLEWNWLMIEKSKSMDYKILRFYSPLCAHRLTST